MKAVVVGSGLLLVLMLALERGGARPIVPVGAVAPAARAQKPPDAKPGTTLLVLRLGPRGLTLVSATEKPARCEPSSEGRGAWVLEDASSGARLAEGCVDLPQLCTCSLGRDHAEGCVVTRHEAVFRLKVPRRAPRERLRIIEASGRELGCFKLESSP